MKTQLDMIKETAKRFCDMVEIEPMEVLPILCNHPYTDNVITYADNQWLNLLKEKDYNQWKQKLFKIISEQTDLFHIYFLVRNPYKLTFLSLIKEYLSPKEFSKIFAKAWTDEENPNMDANVSIEELTEWFKCADKPSLMEQKDLKYFDALPDEFVVYRGVSVNREPYGLSWTRSKIKAEWFAHRFDLEDKKGYVLKAVIKKENALAYLNTRDEREIVVDVMSIRDKIEKV